MPVPAIPYELVQKKDNEYLSLKPLPDLVFPVALLINQDPVGWLDETIRSALSQPCPHPEH